MEKSFCIYSETSLLKRVIVHTPGFEVEAMRPSLAEEALYNDIVPLETVKHQHSELKGFLSKVCEVIELKDALEQTITDKEKHLAFAKLLCDFYSIPHRYDELCSMSAKELADVSICGLKAKHVRLESFLKGNEFDILPLPNMFFMRDAAMVYGNTTVASAMRFAVRSPEALINQFVFANHPDFSNSINIFDGPKLAREGFSLEGGDFQVLAKDVLVIGMGERSSPTAIDYFTRTVSEKLNKKITVFAVELPIARATIHLDMAFSVIDNDACLIYEPVILGSKKSKVIKIEAEPKKDLKFTEYNTILDGLKSVGIDLKPIFTGGNDPLRQEREQWLSGANSFCYAPGKILMYSCNVYTLEALSKEGFEIANAVDYLSGKKSPLANGRLAVGFDGVELARGGGGARCMTCPLERE